MTSISSIETITQRTLSASPPLTPTTSGSHNDRTWLADESGNSKGKGKRKQTTPEDDDLDGVEASPSTDASAYPPVNDEEAETRRVQENLRRWEMAERQRRKQARESMQSPSSLLGDVSRRASLLWSGRLSKHSANSSLGTHVALQSQENINAVHMDDINVSPTPSPVLTPSRRDSTDPDNPFIGPSESLSPFADPHQPLSPTTDGHSSIPRSDESLSSSRVPPTPKPISLPPPLTPPPRVETPPSATSPPKATRQTNSQGDLKETRWWHDWLCGCSEGPDRGGDYQAGRTNPFE
ncbi:hypothetical protein Hypma_002679 [Hypsizygus marmoreus]|uniref:Uncharacterized protein n=1 Tax=Hypsizygus marmoreus TaxID=39966 RepID=A0A369J6H9_HYPMA|nr:hypothetical protein Hypma_002679 [Hypsizygus marmoreus]